MLICVTCFGVASLAGAVVIGQEIVAGIEATETAVAFVPTETPFVPPTEIPPTPTLPVVADPAVTLMLARRPRYRRRMFQRRRRRLKGPCS